MKIFQHKFQHRNSRYSLISLFDGKLRCYWKSIYRVFPSQFVGAVCYSVNTLTPPKSSPRKRRYSKHNASTSPWSCNFVANALTRLMSIVYCWGVVPERMCTLRNDISTSSCNSTQKMSKPMRILFQHFRSLRAGF